MIGNNPHQPMSPVIANSAPEPRLPRLGIVHLMLWTLCSAFCIAIRQFAGELQNIPAAFAATEKLSNGLMGTISGAVLAGTIVLIYSRFKNATAIANQPGHWLLLTGTLGIAMHFCFYFAIWLLQGHITVFPQMLFVYVLMFVVTAVVYGAAVVRSSETRWKLVLAALAIASMLQAGVFLLFCLPTSWQSNLFSFGWLFSIPTIGFILTAIWMLVLSIVEIFVKPQRDWLHWVGVAAFLWGQSTVYALGLVARYST